MELELLSAQRFGQAPVVLLVVLLVSARQRRLEVQQRLEFRSFP